ncbi:DUF6531 domain-containing protein [Kitasatospora paranensis]|uniref:DUF6531 domain-containing protein n=1 Tax=Kitasatospora paranensis TaxID=258053 RepID=UPI003CD0BC04
MSNRIVQALEHGAQKLGRTLAEDAGKAVHKLYRQAGDNLRKVAHNTREIDAEHAKDLERILHGEGGKGLPHPRSGAGGGRGGGSHPRGRGREQVRSPRTEGRPQDTRCGGGEPVDMATGRMYIDQVDAALPGSLPLEFTRSFDSGYLAGRWMGPRWVCTFDERLEIDGQGVVHVRPDRITQAYPHPEPGDPVFASAGSRHELDLDPGTGRYTVTDPATGLVKEFTPTGDGAEALLTTVRDRHGRHYTLAYDPDGTPCPSATPAATRCWSPSTRNASPPCVWPTPQTAAATPCCCATATPTATSPASTTPPASPCASPTTPPAGCCPGRTATTPSTATPTTPSTGSSTRAAPTAPCASTSPTATPTRPPDCAPTPRPTPSGTPPPTWSTTTPGSPRSPTRSATPPTTNATPTTASSPRPTPWAAPPATSTTAPATSPASPAPTANGPRSPTLRG